MARKSHLYSKTTISCVIILPFLIWVCIRHLSIWLLRRPTLLYFAAACLTLLNALLFKTIACENQVLPGFLFASVYFVWVV